MPLSEQLRDRRSPTEVCAHVRDDCSLRQAECPLSMFGCKTIVRAQDVACHLNDHTDEHFTLVAKCMM